MHPQLPGDSPLDRMHRQLRGTQPGPRQEQGGRLGPAVAAGTTLCPPSPDLLVLGPPLSPMVADHPIDLKGQRVRMGQAMGEGRVLGDREKDGATPATVVSMLSQFFSLALLIPLTGANAVALIPKP